METSIYEVVQKLEKMRKQLWSHQVMTGIFLIGGWILILLRLKFLGYLIFWIGVFYAGTLGTHQKRVKESYRDQYKEAFVPMVLKEMLDQANYTWVKGFTEGDVMSSGLVKMGNQFHSEDYIFGMYKGVQFQQADVHVQRVYQDGQYVGDGIINMDSMSSMGGMNGMGSMSGTRNSSFGGSRGRGRYGGGLGGMYSGRYGGRYGGKKQVVTMFKGRMFIFGIEEKDIYSVKIFSKAFLQHDFLDPDKNQKVEMENVEFNRYYNVYAGSGHDVFYLLTPPLMEKLLKLRRRFPDIAMRFSDEKLYVAISGNFDAFEPNMSKPVNYPEEKARMKEDVQVILDMVDIIGLIGNKKSEEPSEKANDETSEKRSDKTNDEMNDETNGLMNEETSEAMNDEISEGAGEKKESKFRLKS